MKSKMRRTRMSLFFFFFFFFLEDFNQAGGGAHVCIWQKLTMIWTNLGKHCAHWML